MVFDPANVAKGFLGGVAAGQQQQARGLDIERMRKEVRAKEAQERKREQISGLLGQFVGGKGDRQQITGQLAGLGTEGVQALRAGAGFLGEERQREQQPTTEQAEAGKKLVNALPYAMNVTDEQEWRTQAFPYISDAFVQSGGDPELVRRLNTMPMDQAKQVMQQMFKESQAKVPTGDYKTYQDTSTGKTITLNEADPRDQAYLRENRENLVPAPTREEVGRPGEFAAPTKKEAQELREAEISTKQAIAGANDLLERLTETPDLLQTTTGIAQFASGVGSEIRSAARAAGVEIPEEITDIAAYEDTFAELGIKNKIAKGLAFDLALSYAAASGLGTGRALTDRDIRLAMQRIGAKGMDTPAARKAAIQDVQRVLERNFKIRYESLTGKPYPGELGMKPTKPTKGGVEVPEMVGGQSTIDMPEGSEIRGAGVTYVKRGGIWQKK